MTTQAPLLQGGIVTALVTPFDAHGEVDWAALDTLVDFQVEHGVDGLFVLGTSGEGMLLSAAERGRVTEHVLTRVAGRLAVVVHCGALDTRSAIGLVRDAVSLGTRAVAAIPPLFFDYGEAGVMAHFRALAETAADVDHYVYENPGRTGYAISADLVHRMFATIEPIRGVKDTGDSVGRIAAYLSADEDMRVFTGNNTIVLGALATGAVGAVSTTSNIVPELFTQLLAAFRSGDLATSRRLQYDATRLQRALAGMPYVAAAKFLLHLRGLPGGPSRSPLPDLSPDQRTSLECRIRQDPALSAWIASA